MESSIKDTPMHRTTIDEMSTEDLEKFVLTLRDRRLKPVHLYEEQQAQVKEVRDVRLREQMAKQLEAFKRDLERTDAWLTKLENRMQKIKRLKFEIELS